MRRLLSPIQLLLRYTDRSGVGSDRGTFACIAARVREDAAREHDRDLRVGMEVRVPTARRLKGMGQQVRQPSRVGVGPLEPDECPPRRLLTHAGVDTFELLQHQRDAIDHRTGSKTLRHDRTTDHP